MQQLEIDEKKCVNFICWHLIIADGESWKHFKIFVTFNNIGDVFREDMG